MRNARLVVCFFFFNDTATTEIYTLSLHDALPIYLPPDANCLLSVADHCLRTRNYVNLIIIDKQPELQWLDMDAARDHCSRSEEHTSELQSPCNLVCRLLLEKKKSSSRPTSTELKP